MLRPPQLNILHRKGSNYYNLAANICFLYNISSSSTDLSINCLETRLHKSRSSRSEFDLSNFVLGY